MASNIEFVEFVSSQLEKLGIVRYRKMFGDYMVYVNEKPTTEQRNTIFWTLNTPKIC